MTRGRASLVALLLVTSAACAPPEGAAGCQEPTAVTTAIFSQSLDDQLDLLFLVDDSSSMQEKQAALREYLPRFMAPLMERATKPDVHVGIITSDLGAGPYTPPTCGTIGGDRGLLQNTPGDPARCGLGAGQGQLKDPSSRFLRYVPWPRGDEISNFDGDLGDAFACYAAVGRSGCNFEQQLAAVRAALDGCNTDAGCTQAQNQGFLRPDAYLAVVLLTDADDCSVPADTQLFDPEQTALLGPLTAYRCFEFGTLCDGAPPGRGAGPRSGCEPGHAGPLAQFQLTPVEELASFLKALKPQDPRMVYVSVIAAPPAPVDVALDGDGQPTLQPSCTGAIGTGTPGIRLSRFVSEFDSDRASFISICASDLSAAMEKFSMDGYILPGSQCLPAPLADRHPSTPALDVDCLVQDRTVVNAAAGVYAYRTVPPCDETICDPATMGDCTCRQHAEVVQKGACWYLWPDAVCTWPQTSGYQIKVDRGLDETCINPYAARYTDLVVQCGTCVVSDATGSGDCSAGCRGYWPESCPDPLPAACESR